MMEWDHIFNKKSSESEENNGPCLGSATTAAFGTKKPLRDVNIDRLRTFSSQSFKSPDKTLDQIEDSQDSGVSFSPSQCRVKKLARRLSKTMSPAFSKPGSFESAEEDMEIGDCFDEEDFELTPVPDMPKSMTDEKMLNINKLLTGPIKHVPVSESENDCLEMNKENLHIRKPVSRKIFGFEDNSTPPSSKTGEFFKRPNAPEDLSSPAVVHKRIKSASQGELLSSSRNRLNISQDGEDGSSEEETSEMDLSYEAPRPKPIFVRSQSESAVTIMKAMELVEQDSMLIGDASKRYVLPIMDNGKHKDLKEISTETLVRVLKGEFSSCVERFEVIDCRYPYEFEGGHIKGAINIHTQKQLHEKYLESKHAVCSTDPRKGRHIIIFHCEFSSQRAPDLCRFLREADRKCNRNSFPNLHYPELYVLYGGYKAFFQSHKEHCDPETYLQMDDLNHTADCKLYKTRSKNDVVSMKPSSSTAVSKVRKPNLTKKFNGF